jgi:hypothetical protein
MKTVYEALNIVEAHMLADLLKQEGCSVQIQGEHLIGALGELPAAGLIRLTVDEAEYAAARAFILQWEAAQPKETPQMKPKSPISRIWFAAIGVLIGIAVTFLFFSCRTTQPALTITMITLPMSAGFIRPAAG